MKTEVYNGDKDPLGRERVACPLYDHIVLKECVCIKCSFWRNDRCCYQQKIGEDRNAEIPKEN